MNKLRNGFKIFIGIMIVASSIFIKAMLWNGIISISLMVLFMLKLPIPFVEELLMITFAINHIWFYKEMLAATVLSIGIVMQIKIMYL